MEEIQASIFTDAQKGFIVKQGNESTTVTEIYRKAGISPATYFCWKKKFEGLMPSEMRRLRDLKNENSRLKRNVADLTLDRQMLQDVIKRKLEGGIVSVSLLAKCVLIGASRSAKRMLLCNLFDQPTITNPVAPVQPR